MNETPERPGQAVGSALESAAIWRDARLDDAEAISAIEHLVHTLMHESVDVFREKIALFGAGCRIWTTGKRTVGYGIAYPWRLDDVPPLDRLLGAIPSDADCLFLHDVAILPQARAAGASRAFVDYAAELAVQQGLSCLALVSVYGTDGLWGRRGFVPRASATTSTQLGPYGDTAVYMVRRLTDSSA